MARISRKDAEARTAWLRAEIERHNHSYYVDNAPTITDFEFDLLMAELIALEERFPDLSTEDSPTRHVGSDLAAAPVTVKGDAAPGNGNFRRARHRYPMLSLGNTYSVDDIKSFHERIVRMTDTPFRYSAELKFDGTAICLTYRNGELFQALTRGDGSVGDDVTENVLTINGIPRTLHGDDIPEEFEIRGEIYMPYKAFDALNAERESQEEALFANPRNAASGSLKLTDSGEVASRNLECVLYHMVGDSLPFRTHTESLAAAGRWGLPTSPYSRVCSSVDEVLEYISYWDIQRKFLPFATDGIVIKVDELPLRESLGYTAKFPRWATAFKFKAEQALTRLISIDYQVGRTGAVTPVANLDPVQLSGSVIRRASLHNLDQMNLLDVRIGDRVYIEKGGEIIPKIVGVELSMRPVGADRPEFPSLCPDCGAALVRDEGEARHYCPNSDNCPTQIKSALVHFTSRKAMNILAGEATVDQLFNSGMVRDFADLYSLTKQQLMTLDGWQERSAERFLESVGRSLSRDFDAVLYALGIRHVGETTARMLAGHYRTMDALRAASFEELVCVGDIGGIIAASIREWFEDPCHIALLGKLKDAGLKFEMLESDERISDVLAGAAIVVTGSFSIPREEMKRKITAYGGRNVSSVSGSTDYLLAGEKCGPEKIRKAEKLGVKVISEKDFYNMTDGK